ncbi:hypothetical protein ACLB1G_12855 [Oxalobacteraceae bacterium A2-2]
MFKTLACASLMTLLPTGAALAQPAAPAAGAPAAGAPAADAALHHITGFRSARFGMTEDQVRQAVAQDFKDAASQLQAVDNRAEQTRSLVLPLPALDPVGLPASVTYIFGAASHQLIHVNVLWASAADASPQLRSRYAAGGLQLVSYFRGLRWKPDGVVGGIPAGPGGVVLFGGVDPDNALVEVRLSGVAIQGQDGVSAPPAGPTRLRIAYAAAAGKPDVARSGKK